MTSTGNDIVSLNAINSFRTKQPGYYSKILSTSEQTLYKEQELSALPFEYFVWLLWSIKESAFKYLQRIKPDLVFSPTKFIVSELQLPLGYATANSEARELEGNGFETVNNKTKLSIPVINSTINIGTQILYSRSIVRKDLIMSVVNGDENFKNTWWGFKRINTSDSIYQSVAVRAFLLKRLQSVYRDDYFTISKSDQGYPTALNGNEEKPVPVSLSHHEQFVAYSFLVSN